MKLRVHGQLNIYEITIGRGTYSVRNCSLGLDWDTRGVVGLPSDSVAERIALTAIDAVDGPVQVERLSAA